MSEKIEITKTEAAEIAEALHVLADLDEGENLDVRRLRELASKLYVKSLSRL